MGYNELRPLAFRLAPSIETLPHSFVTMSLPSEMKSSARQAIAIATRGDVSKVRLPIRVLNRAAQMLIPDVVSIERDADKHDVHTWLYGQGEEPAIPFALQQILRAWTRTAFPRKVSEEARQEIVQLIATETLRWQSHTIDLARWRVADNGTASPYIKGTPLNSFVLLPDLIASRLSAPDVVFEWGIHQLHFRRASLAPGKSGTELISWPPLEYHESEQRIWPFSVVLTLTLQTIPFQPFPQLHSEIGIRRWAGPPIERLPSGRQQTSIYLLDTVPWIDGLHNSGSFQVAPISWKRKPKSERKKGSSEYYLNWDSALVRLLNDLHPKPVFPNPEELSQRPYEYMRDTGPSAALVFRNGIKPPHEVGAGLMPRDRFLFAEQLAEYLKPEFEFIPTFNRRTYHVSVSPNPFFAKVPKEAEQHEKEDEEGQEPLAGTHADRRLALRQTTQERFTLEIYYQSAQIHDALFLAVQTLLLGELPVLNKDEQVWSTHELELTVRALPLGSRGDALKIKPGSAETLYDRVRDAIRQRVETMQPLPHATGRVGAIIELDDAEMFNDDDPKPALRIAYARQGRLTQFVTPLPDENRFTEVQKKKERKRLEQRALSAVRDLLRQFAVQGVLPRIAPQRGKEKFYVPDPLHYLGVWLIKQYAESSPTHVAQILPVFVHMLSSAPGIQVLAPGLRAWLDYPDALAAFAEGQGLGVKRARDAYQFILDTLTRCLPSFGDTLLLCHAQNLRSTWAWLQNESITMKLSRELERYPQLRIVRLRTGVHETPEWYGQSEKEAYGLPHGLFSIGESGYVFASVQEKPPNAKPSKELSKILSRVVRNPRTKEEKVVGPSPEVTAWNPGIVEMTAVCTDPTEAQTYAIVANELRHHFASHYAQPTVLPLPLHLAALLGEYVLPLNPLIKGADDEEFYAEDER
jgi:hypothetical protein